MQYDLKEALKDVNNAKNDKERLENLYKDLLNDSTSKIVSNNGEPDGEISQ